MRERGAGGGGLQHRPVQAGCSPTSSRPERRRKEEARPATGGPLGPTATAHCWATRPCRGLLGRVALGTWAPALAACTGSTSGQRPQFSHQGQAHLEGDSFARSREAREAADACLSSVCQVGGERDSLLCLDLDRALQQYRCPASRATTRPPSRPCPWIPGSIRATFVLLRPSSKLMVG